MGFVRMIRFEKDDAFERESVVHGEGEYVDGKVTSTLARATGRCCARGSRPIEASQKTNSHSISGRFSSAESYSIMPVKKRSNTLLEPLSEINNCYT